jgi:hypothetical protein
MGDNHPLRPAWNGICRPGRDSGNRLGYARRTEQHQNNRSQGVVWTTADRLPANAPLPAVASLRFRWIGCVMIMNVATDWSAVSTRSFTRLTRRFQLST